MIVNQKEEDNITEWKIGEMKIVITNQYTYLGEIIDSKCRMMPHLEEKKNKMLWMTKRITGIMKEEVFWKTRPETTLDVYEKTIIPAAWLRNMKVNMPRRESIRGPPSTDIEKHNEATKINPNNSSIGRDWMYENETQDS